MRLLLGLLALVGVLATVSPAHAWYDRYGYWHPNHHYYRYYAYHWPYRHYYYHYHPRVYAGPPGYYYRAY
jgi:hypothetical protein